MDSNNTETEFISADDDDEENIVIVEKGIIVLDEQHKDNCRDFCYQQLNNWSTW